MNEDLTKATHSMMFAAITPQDDGSIDPCAVERWIHQEQHVPDDSVFANNIKCLIDDWVYYRSTGMDAIASSCRDRLSEIIEAIKQIE